MGCIFTLATVFRTYLPGILSLSLRIVIADRSNITLVDAYPGSVHFTCNQFYEVNIFYIYRIISKTLNKPTIVLKEIDNIKRIN